MQFVLFFFDIFTAAFLNVVFRTSSPESRKLVKWNAEDALEFLRKSERGNPSFEDYIVRKKTIQLVPFYPLQKSNRLKISDLHAKILIIFSFFLGRKDWHI